MTPEEFQKIKEAEKAHLRKLKQLKEAVRVFERQKKISGAVTDMTSSIEEKMDEHREAVERVALDAARAEARLEMALEAADEKVERRAHEIDDEEALREHRAKELIRQIKGHEPDHRERPHAGKSPARDHSSPGTVSDSTLPDAASDTSSDASSGTSSGTSSGNESDEDPPPIPDKTIGRMKP